MLGGGTQNNSHLKGYQSSIGLNTYPHMYFDLSSQEIPRTVKELFRWCLFLYQSHSEIAPTINKKCAYVITDIVYDSDSKKDVDIWKSILEDTLDVQTFKYEMLLDFEVYGNAFTSIFFPFERHLVCRHCEHRNTITDKDLTWWYRQFKFGGICMECDAKGEFDPEDTPVMRTKSLRLIRWFPEYIKILRNDITGREKHHYQVPKAFKKQLANSEHDQNKFLAEDTPLVFLEAIKRGKDVELDENTFYHMKNPGISSYDQSYGIPPLLSVFKDAWLYQTYRRAQEAIAMEHVLPMRLLSPRPASGDHSPHAHADLGQWANRMQNITSRFRRDPNGMYTMPFPAELINVGGDAQALNVHNDMQQIRSNIAMGLDLPLEVSQGTVSWSGSSVALRMLENQYIGRIKNLDKYMNTFLLPKIRAWADLPDVDIRHKDFKMADDAQQKQIALTLRQTNTISDRTVVQELGFDYAKEQEYKRMEEEDRNRILESQMTSQARAQGAAQIITAEFQAQAEVAAQKASEDAQRKNHLDSYDELIGAKAQSDMSNIAQSVGAPSAGEIGGSELSLNASTLQTMADQFLKATPPEQMEDAMMRLQSQGNTLLAGAVQKRQKMIEQSNAKIKPLPEQKPPRGANATI